MFLNMINSPFGQLTDKPSVRVSGRRWLLGIALNILHNKDIRAVDILKHNKNLLSVDDRWSPLSGHIRIGRRPKLTNRPVCSPAPDQTSLWGDASAVAMGCILTGDYELSLMKMCTKCKHSGKIRQFDAILTFGTCKIRKIKMMLKIA